MRRSINYTNLLRMLTIFLGIFLTLILIGLVQFTELNQKVQDQRSTIELIDRASDLLKAQGIQLARFEELPWLGGKNDQELENHLDFVAYLEKSCRAHELTLVALPRETRKEKEGLLQVHEKFQLEGPLHAQLELLHQIEIQNQLGCLKRIQLEKQKVRIGREQRELLLAQIELNRLLIP